MNSKKIYLYLAKRDRKGAKVIMTLQGLETTPARVSDLGQLRLNPEIMGELADIVHQHRLEWEPWVESADNYNQLRQQLISRGFSNIPINGNPLHSQSSFNNPHVADARQLKRKVMVKKPT